MSLFTKDLKFWWGRMLYNAVCYYLSILDVYYLFYHISFHVDIVLLIHVLMMSHLILYLETCVNDRVSHYRYVWHYESIKALNKNGV